MMCWCRVQVMYNNTSLPGLLCIRGVLLLLPLPVTFNGRESLEIIVEDEDRIVNEFLGFVSILMGDLADKRKVSLW